MDEKYAERRFSYERYTGEPRVSLQDLIVSDVARRLDIPTVEWGPPVEGNRRIVI
jgi:hypothetical protein